MRRPLTVSVSERRDRVISGRALRACLGAQPDEARRMLDQRPSAHPHFAAAARHHGIPGYAWRAFSGGSLAATEAGMELQAGFHWAVARHLRTLAELGTLRTAFDEAGIDWLVFKGPVLAEVVHGEPGLRGYSDLDVLVRPGHLGRALMALEAAGGTTLDKNWDLLLRELRGEIHVVLPYGTVVDLHWHLINQPQARHAFQLDTDELIDRRTSVDVAGHSVPTFDATDALLQLAVHAMLSGGDRLVWFKDLERSVLSRPPAWDELAARCQRTGTALLLAAALELTRVLVPTPALPPRKAGASVVWLWLLRAAFALTPPQHTLERGPIARIIARATRADLPSSLVELGRRLTHRMTDPKRAQRESALGSSHPGSMFHDAGGAGTRAAYLSTVAASATSSERPTHSSIPT